MLIGRFELEENPRDCALYVRALDRAYRRTSAFAKVLPPTGLLLDLSVQNTAIVVDAAHHQIRICRQAVLKAVRAATDEIAAELRSRSPSVASTASSSSRALAGAHLVPLLARLEQTFLVSVKTCLANLLLFTASDITFLTCAESGEWLNGLKYGSVRY